MSTRSPTFLCVFLCLTTWVSLAHSQSDAAAERASAFGFDTAKLAAIDDLAAKEIQTGNTPGCVVTIGTSRGIAFQRAYGDRQVEPTVEKMTVDTVFDMASVTKPVATATSIMLLVERGRVRLRDPIATYIPEFAQNGKADITVEQLLTHQGGLVPDNSLADYRDGPEQAWKNIWALKPVVSPGTKFIYSDVGFLVLGKLVEEVTGTTEAEFASENIFQPLRMKDTGYLPPPELRARAIATEQRDGHWIKGEVHDPRAYLLGGIAGHAGLFSTADDLAKYAQMILHRGAGLQVRVMSPLTLREMLTARNVAGNLRGLGWDRRSRYSSNRGELFTSQAAGHGGFTGQAIWIDPGLDLFVIFLSTRLHPDGVGSVNPLAGRIGTVAAAALLDPPLVEKGADESTTAAASNAPRSTLLGIDVLERDHFATLKNARVGLITNHTGLDRAGRRTVDILKAAKEVDLQAIFSPEHGLQGKLDRNNIGDTTDEETGLPVYSLYGESRKPSAEQLAGLDTLVFDIQDIGTRFYTYISTMGLAMEAAAEHGLRFVVLDRPNPIGGTHVEGPVLDAGKECFVGYHTIPVRHGMTIGELAQMIRAERKLNLDLQIVQVANWQRGELWDQTGLTWTNPSPNMRSLTEALLYPGIGLLETTNLSVGRGTDTPFELIGAPWIDGRKLADSLSNAGLPGIRFVPIRFTPQASKFAGEACEGVNFIITDRSTFLPVQTGLTVAITLHRLFPDAWQSDRFNRLLMDDAVYEAFLKGKNYAELEMRFDKELGEFMARRRQFLLYPE